MHCDQGDVQVNHHRTNRLAGRARPGSPVSFSPQRAIKARSLDRSGKPDLDERRIVDASQDQPDSWGRRHRPGRSGQTLLIGPGLHVVVCSACPEPLVGSFSEAVSPLRTVNSGSGTVLA